MLGFSSLSILSVVCLKQVPRGGAKLVAQLIFLGKAMLSCAAQGKASFISTLLDAQGAMVYWLERLLVKQEDLGSIAAQTKWFFVSSGIRR